MYVYHNTPAHRLIDIIDRDGPKQVAIVMDSEGRSFRIPAYEPFEVPQTISMDTDTGGKPQEHRIPSEKVGAQIIKDGTFYGIVELKTLRTDRGITFDIDTANRESTRVREQAETEIVERYVAHAKDNQLKNMPIRPPSEAIERILNERGMDLHRDYGIQPVGYKVSQAAAQRDRKLAELETVNAAQAKELSEIKEMLAMLLEDKDKESKRKKSQTPVSA